ncbi:MAG: ATPase domain-containing protein [Nitrososphaerales archaeon]
MTEGQRRLAAIMFIDMVGYTALTQRDEARALKLLEIHRQLLEPILKNFGGQIIKIVGDGTLVELPSALQAAQCALDVQIAFHDYNLKNPSDGIRLRIGIHIGDVVHSAGDVYGDAVNIASRIEPVSEPGGICVSEQVFVQVRNKIRGSPMVKIPPQRLKNVEVPVEIYKVIMPWEGVPSSDEIALTASSNLKRISTGIATLDREIGGGFPEGTATLAYGAPKTGKSVFSLQFMVESIRKAEPCLFIMTDYVCAELVRAASSFGWDIQDALKNGLVSLLDMTSAQMEKHVEVSFGSSVQFVSVADLADLMTRSDEALKHLSHRGNSYHVVLDSLTPLFIYNPPLLVAKLLRHFALKMKSLGSVGILVTYVEGSIDSQSELIIKSGFDNLLHLRDGELIIEGMLGTPRMRMAYKVTSEGLKVGI